MLIVNNEQVLSYHPVIKYIPSELRKYILGLNFDNIEEIRLRRGIELSVFADSKAFFVNRYGELSENRTNGVTVTDRDIKEALELICESSLYAVEECIKNGYITVKNGCRIGISGSAVVKNGQISTIKNISGLNYRLAREIKGSADALYDSIIKEGQVLNTLIISPPGCGKTTVLRDIARKLSQNGYKVSIADDRNEISAMHNGFMGYDLGSFCDVLEGAEKSEAMTILIRTMSPQVIITDELGNSDDIRVVKRALTSGVSVIATMHGREKKDIEKTAPELCEMFDCFIILSRRNGPSTIERIEYDF